MSEPAAQKGERLLGKWVMGTIVRARLSVARIIVHGFINIFIYKYYTNHTHIFVSSSVWDHNTHTHTHTLGGSLIDTERALFTTSTRAPRVNTLCRASPLRVRVCCPLFNMRRIQLFMFDAEPLRNRSFEQNMLINVNGGAVLLGLDELSTTIYIVLWGG